MKRLLVAGLLAGAIAVPTAMAERPSTAPATPAAHHPAKAVVSYLFVGVVDGTTTADTMMVRDARGVNRHARRALGTATAMTVHIQPTTHIKGRILAPDGTKVFVNETFADLKDGDRVFFHVRAPKGSSLDALMTTKWIRDLTQDPPAPAAPAPTV